MANSQPHSDLLTYVGLKTLEPRRYSHALTRFYKCLYNMGLNNIKECSYLEIINMTSEAFASLISLPITVLKVMEQSA